MMHVSNIPSLYSSIDHTPPTQSTTPDTTSPLCLTTLQNNIPPHALCDVIPSSFGKKMSSESTPNLLPPSPPMTHHSLVHDSSQVCVSQSLNIDSTTTTSSKGNSIKTIFFRPKKKSLILTPLSTPHYQCCTSLEILTLVSSHEWGI